MDLQKPILGAEFIEHDELFFYLRNEFESRTLTKPIELFHLDAHADLGLDRSASSNYVMTDLLHRPVKQRAYPKIGGPDGLTPGSWLLFAVACRWIGSLVYVHHPTLHLPDLLDIPSEVMKN
ncbi:MAG: UPF0489 family protein, partial [Planctomycetes bacterium]|nr:UPF0489 family protein [Planctomycetota bacterium]